MREINGDVTGNNALSPKNFINQQCPKPLRVWTLLEEFVLNLPLLPLVHTMIYMNMPVIIPVLAAGYLLTIYLLLTLAQRTIKNSRYVDSSLTDVYVPYLSTNDAPQTDEGNGWSRPMGSMTAIASEDLQPSMAPSQKVQEASSLP